MTELERLTIIVEKFQTNLESLADLLQMVAEKVGTDSDRIDALEVAVKQMKRKVV